MKPRMPNSPPAVALDAARAHIAELEAAQPDQKSLFGFDLKNDKPDNIAEAIIGNVDLGRAEKIARAILKAVKAKSQKPGPDHAVDSDHHLTHQRPTARGPVTSPAAAQQPRRRAVEGQGDLNRPRRAHVRHQQGDRRGRMGAKDRRSRKRRGSHCAASHPRHGSRRHARRHSLHYPNTARQGWIRFKAIWDRYKLHQHVQGIGQHHWTTRLLIVTAVAALCSIAFVAGLRIGAAFSGG